MELGMRYVVCAFRNILAGLKGISEQKPQLNTNASLSQGPFIQSLIFIWTDLLLPQLSVKDLVYRIKSAVGTGQVTEQMGNDWNSDNKSTSYFRSKGICGLLWCAIYIVIIFMADILSHTQTGT